MFLRSRNRVISLILPLTVAAVGCGDDDTDTPAVDAAPPMVDAAVDAMMDMDGGPLVCLDEAAIFAEAARNNVIDTDPKLTGPLEAEPNFAPEADAPVLTGGATPPDDGFFDTSATFIGAIGTEDWTADWTAYPVDDPVDNIGTVNDVEAGDITEDETWTSGNTYILKGKVFITGDATLTIEAGTLVRGDSGSALVITTTGSIDAQGTAADPIIFTSSKESGAAPGDWGGVVLIGEASINVDGGTDNVEGFEANELDRVTYGGSADDGDCGTLRYVRIEYAGFALSEGNELNGLTVAGCGSGTDLDFVQVHRGLDDGIEFFGGTANLKHAVVSLPNDDALDWDYGWRGKAQFIIVKQDANNGDKGFESDNNGDANDATPRSKPTIWNATLIGSNDANAVKSQGGMHLRRGTAGTIQNTIVAYFKEYAVDIDGVATANQVESGDLTITNSYFFSNGGDGGNWPTGFDVSSGEENDCQPAN